MKTTTLLLLLVILLPLVSANTYLVTIDEGEIIDAKRSVATPQQHTITQGEELRLVDAQGRTLETTRVATTTLREPKINCFSPDETYTIKEEINGELVDIEYTKTVYDDYCSTLTIHTTQYAYLPYHPRGVRIQYNNQEYDVQTSSNYCGNNQCDAEETWFSCRQDCTEPIRFTPEDEHHVNDLAVEGQYYVVYGNEQCPEDQSCIIYPTLEELEAGNTQTKFRAPSGNPFVFQEPGCTTSIGGEVTFAALRGNNCHSSPTFQSFLNNRDSTSTGNKLSPREVANLAMQYSVVDGSLADGITQLGAVVPTNLGNFGLVWNAERSVGIGETTLQGTNTIEAVWTVRIGGN